MTIASDQWQMFKHMEPWQCGKFRDMFIPCMGHAAAVADAAAAAEAAAACFLGSIILPWCAWCFHRAAIGGVAIGNPAGLQWP